MQDAVASPSKRSNDTAAAAATATATTTTTSSSNGRSPSVVHSDPAILPAPVQQIPPSATQEAKDPALADQHVPATPEVKQSGILPDSPSSSVVKDDFLQSNYSTVLFRELKLTQPT